MTDSTVDPTDNNDVDPNAAPDGDENPSTNSDEDTDAGDGDGDEDESGDEDEDDDEDGEPFDAKRAKAKIAKVNREAKGLRRTNKALVEENTTLKARVQEIDDANLSDLEKANKRAEAAEAKAAELEKSQTRTTIMTEFGLTEAQVKRLSGDTLEELREDAEEYCEENGIAKPGSKPKPRRASADEVDGGRTPGRDTERPDPKKLAAGIRRR